jgi:nicotinamidase-related amidase
MIQARPFNFPYDGNFDPTATALVIVDMQEDFLGPEGYFALKGYDPSPLRAIIPNVAALAHTARRAGCRIIWTRQGYRADLADLTPYERWRAERSGISYVAGAASSLMRGHAGFEIVSDLPPARTDILVDKTANGAFYQTDLDVILRAQRITHLLFAGCTTDVCVHTTLREANDRKYQCLLVEDACASGDQYAHDAAVHMVTVEDGIFGTVSDTRSVLAALESFGAKHV